MSHSYNQTENANSEKIEKRSGLTRLCMDDSTPNRYVLHFIWFFMAALVLCIILQMLGIFVVDNAIAMNGLLSGVAFLLLAELLGGLVKSSKVWLKYALLALSVSAVTVVGVFMTYHAVLTSIMPLLLAAQYSRRRVTIFTYVLTIISIFVVALFGYAFGLSDANMVIQTVSQSVAYGDTLSGPILPLSERWLSLALYFALPRSLIITSLVPVINAIVKNRQEIMLRQIETKYRGEHDRMTGLYNREKFATKLNEAYLTLEKVAIIYFDLNNLKRINDSYGHDAGDEMICRAADSIKSAVTENMDAYRLGGDEFMVVIPEGDLGDADALIESWKSKLAIMNSLPGRAECQLAYGCAAGKGQDFPEILKIADKNMYVNKQHSKAQTTK